MAQPFHRIISVKSNVGAIGIRGEGGQELNFFSPGSLPEIEWIIGSQHWELFVDGAGWKLRDINTSIIAAQIVSGCWVIRTDNAVDIESSVDSGNRVRIRPNGKNMNMDVSSGQAWGFLWSTGAFQIRSLTPTDVRFQMQPSGATSLTALDAVTADADVLTSGVSFYLDETAGQLRAKAKEADGTTIHDFLVATL